MAFDVEVPPAERDAAMAEHLAAARRARPEAISRTPEHARNRQCTFHRGAKYVELRQRAGLTAEEPGLRENLSVPPLRVRACSSATAARGRGPGDRERAARSRARRGGRTFAGDDAGGAIGGAKAALHDQFIEVRAVERRLDAGDERGVELATRQRLELASAFANVFRSVTLADHLPSV